MTEQTSAQSGAPEPFKDHGGALTPREAVQLLRQRDETPAPAEPPKEEAPPVEDNAAPPEEAPSATEEPDQAELPPIEPPRSWSKDDKDLFNTLPRETQERIAERERARERDFSRRQQEATEKAKALAAEKTKVEQVRSQYEQSLPQLLHEIQTQISGEFSDIKSWADLHKMQAEDPHRFQRWQLVAEKQKAYQAQLNAVQQRVAAQHAAQWANFAKEQDDKFLASTPEMADETKAKALRASAVKVLQDLGFSDQELDETWERGKKVSIRDHRIQTLIRDATKWRESQEKAKQVRQAPIPPVVKPSAKQVPGARNEARISQLETLLQTATGLRAVRLGTELQQLKRAAK